MKKLFCLFLTISFIGFGLVSCGSDDDTANRVDPLLLGKWEISKVGELINGQEFLIDYENPEGCDNFIFEFKENGVYLAHDFFGNECEEDIEEGRYTFLDHLITIKTEDEEEEFVFSIITLDETTLKVRNETFDEDLDEMITSIFIFNKK